MGYKAYKVIDAKDGIIERFEYESATFKIVERREPKAGDYLVIMDEESARKLGGVTVGKPYTIEDVYVFADDDGDLRYRSKGSYNHAIYEKVDPPKTTITHEGRAYKLVDRRAKDGDIIICDNDTDNHVTAGFPYRVTNGEDSEPAFIDNHGARLYVYRRNRTESNVKVYEPVVPKKRLIYRDSEGITHTVLDAELIAYSSVEEVPE
ncbi:hypothetical protein P8825_14305 [Shouchella clausii]|uniref:hypothetical protein n=1 Tax=Shouchella clausii TaxID=79880 RepID=UPI002DB5F619|nr:hypothetical protein [Shouchella clausii]MEB5480736.1 hypothetical protein [Shouchella clausii]